MTARICRQVSDRNTRRTARQGGNSVDPLPFEQLGPARGIEIDHGPAVHRQRRTAPGRWGRTQ